MICVLNDPLIFEQYILHTNPGQASRVLLYFPFFTKVGTTAFLVEWKTVLAALLFLLQHCFMHNAIALLCFDSLLGYCFTMQYVFARKTIPFPFVCPLIALNLKICPYWCWNCVILNKLYNNTNIFLWPILHLIKAAIKPPHSTWRGPLTMHAYPHSAVRAPLIAHSFWRVIVHRSLECFHYSKGPIDKIALVFMSSASSSTTVFAFWEAL